jgi:hypothetical protein
MRLVSCAAMHGRSLGYSYSQISLFNLFYYDVHCIHRILLVAHSLGGIACYSLLFIII